MRDLIVAKEHRVSSRPGSALSRPIIVAVDGPAGSGKSSICTAVCREIGYTYVNTGFLYRAVAYLCNRHAVSLDNQEALKNLIQDFSKNLIWEPKTGAVIISGEDIAPRLYTDEAGRLASSIATNELVRKELLPLQRRLALEADVGAIVDGRDIGTVVFPDADVKVFMTASLEVRANRRLKQLEGATAADLDEIMESIAKRDRQDSKRGSAPLKQAEDAILLDTSALNPQESMTALRKLISDYSKN